MIKTCKVCSSNYETNDKRDKGWTKEEKAKCILCGGKLVKTPVSK